MVGPVVFLLLIGILVSGIGVFRCHQISALANEGARWASVHGPKYAKQSGGKLPNSEDVFAAAIRPLATSLDLANLNYDVQWNENQTLVTVTVNYRWLPAGLGFNSTIRGIREMPVSN